MTGLASIFFTPAIPVWLLLPLLLLCIWGAYRGYQRCSLTARQCWLLWGLRTAAFLLLGLFVCQPSRRTEQVQQEKPILAVLIDNSASMQDNPFRTKQKRSERVMEYLHSSSFQAVAKQSNPLFYAVGDDVSEINSPDTLPFNAPESAIAPALKKVAQNLKGERVAAFLLLSDGLDRNPENGRWTGLPPVFTLETEEPAELGRQPTDFAISNVACPRRVLVNWKTTIQVSVRRKAGQGIAQFNLLLKQDGEILAKRLVVFRAEDSLTQTTFEITPMEVGQFVYELDIEPPEDDDAENNHREFLVDVSDARRKILYLEGTARWEFKFLKRTLQEEKNLQLGAYLRKGPGEFIDFDEESNGIMPALDEKSLRAYRSVILGNLPQDAFSDEELGALRSFVEHGGGLLFVGGAQALGEGGLAQHPALAGLLPVISRTDSLMREGKHTLQFTAEGAALPMFSQLAQEMHFPPVLTVWSPVNLGRAATVLLQSGEGLPVLVTSRFGEGRVAMLLTDTMWRWQLGSTATTGKSVYTAFFTQLLHWLSPEQNDLDDALGLQLALAGYEAQQNQKITVGALGGKQGKGISCTIQSPSGKTLNIPMIPGKIGKECGLAHSQDGFRCDLVLSEEGTYDITAETADGTQRATARVLVRFPEQEKTGAPIDRAYLRRLSEETGGSYARWDDRDSLWDGVEFPTTERTVTYETPLWNRWWLLLLLIAIFTAEWALRRLWDLA